MLTKDSRLIRTTAVVNRQAASQHVHQVQAAMAIMAVILQPARFRRAQCHRAAAVEAAAIHRSVNRQRAQCHQAAAMEAQSTRHTRMDRQRRSQPILVARPHTRNILAVEARLRIHNIQTGLISYELYNFTFFNYVVITVFQDYSRFCFQLLLSNN